VYPMKTVNWIPYSVAKKMATHYTLVPYVGY
jgi:hypothetical protein